MSKKIDWVVDKKVKEMHFTERMVECFLKTYQTFPEDKLDEAVNNTSAIVDAAVQQIKTDLAMYASENNVDDKMGGI